MIAISLRPSLIFSLMLHTILFVSVAYSQEAFRISIPNLEQARMQPVTASSDGGFYMFSEVSDDNGLRDSNALVRFSSEGTPLWGRSIVVADQEIEPYAIFTAPDGDLILTAEVLAPRGESRLEGNRGFLVMRLDSMGKLRWAKHYMSGRGVNGFYSLVLDDGSILISGSRERDLQDKADPSISAFLFRIDGSGNLIWSKGLQGADPKSFLGFGPFCQKRNGRLSGTASFTTPANISSAEGMIVEMTVDGDVLKGETMRDPATGASLDYSYFHGIVATADGGAMAAGQADMGYYSDFVVNLADDGSIRRCRLFNNNLSIRNCVQLSPEKILFAGGSHHSIFVELDHRGQVARSAQWRPFSDNGRVGEEEKRSAYIYTNVHHTVLSDGTILFAAGVDSIAGSRETLLVSFTADFGTCSGPAMRNNLSTETDLEFVRADSLTMVPVPLEVRAPVDVRIENFTAKPNIICRSKS